MKNQKIIDAIADTTAELVLLGYPVPAPQSHRRGAADLVRLGLWDQQGQLTDLGEQVKKALLDARDALIGKLDAEARVVEAPDVPAA